MEDFLTKTHCDRCGGELIARVTSMINEDTICLSCKEVERHLPIYEQARAVEFGEVKNGNYRYEGVGFEKPDTSKRCDLTIIITKGNRLHIAYDYGEPKVSIFTPEMEMLFRNLLHNGSIEVKDLRGGAEDLSLSIKPTAEADTVDALISVLEAHRDKKLSCCGSSCIVNVVGNTVVLDTEELEEE